ncbi:hypothetical protein JW758_00615 [Candidatus Peregrinibacteria bacterium]|nr:hypothetical protein [Candidatus Peregrinibacteria bacterium]
MEKKLPEMVEVYPVDDMNCRTIFRTIKEEKLRDIESIIAVLNGLTFSSEETKGHFETVLRSLFCQGVLSPEKIVLVGEGVEMDAVNTDAVALYNKAGTGTAGISVCEITGQPIVPVSGSIKELRDRLNRTTNESPSGKLRRIIRNSDPKLN